MCVKYERSTPVSTFRFRIWFPRDFRNRIYEIKSLIFEIFPSKTPVTPSTTSRGGLGGRSGVGAAVSLSEQILQVRSKEQDIFISPPTFVQYLIMFQGAANAKRNSPGTSSASSEGNDDAAMAVIMSLLEVSQEETFLSCFYCNLHLIPGWRWSGGPSGLLWIAMAVTLNEVKWEILWPGLRGGIQTESNESNKCKCYSKKYICPQLDPTFWVNILWWMEKEE